MDAQVDLVSLDPRGQQIREIRGGEIAMIFQEPMTSLNPLHAMATRSPKPSCCTRRVNKQAALARAEVMLERVHISEPRQRLHEYPHQLSGGMRQRVMIAMALSCNPSILIADEPTTALDVTVQAQILDLMRELQDEFGSSIMLITHNLGVVSQMADQIGGHVHGQSGGICRKADHIQAAAASVYGRLAKVCAGAGPQSR